MSGHPSEQTCEHESWFYEERDNETWNVCVDCDFAELWANGMLVDTTDILESCHLDAVEDGRV